MPRTKPIPSEDAKIAQRIKAVRIAWKVSRSFVAERCETTAGEIARIELGRMPLKYGIAKKLLRYFDLNPAWLMTGTGRQRSYVPLPDAVVIGMKENSLFSVVFNTHFRKLLSANPKDEAESESSVYTRYVTAVMRCADIHLLFREVPDGYVLKLDEAIKTFGALLLEKWPADAWERTLERRTMFDTLSKWSSEQDAALKSPQSKPTKKELYNVSDYVNNSDVKPKLPNLLERLKIATAKRGKKSELAKFLKVSLVQVSQWLAGDREPGGETTLRLLHWVEQQERQK